ncbi:MAG: hypothetical protein QHC90_29145 [Shinella sp.]|nr:hypothetical protein [Shinella sp.]
MAEGFGEVLDAQPVEIGDVRVNVGNVRWGFGEASDDFDLLSLKVSHTDLHRRLIHAVLYGRDDTGNRLLDFRKRLLIGLRLHAPVTVQPVHFLRIGFDGFRNRFR